MTATGRVDLGRALKGGAPVLLELAVLFCAGGSAAAVSWALLEPMDSTAGGHMAADPFASASPLAARLAADPFLKQAPTAALASFGSAEGYALHATRVSASGLSAILSAPGLPQMSYAVGAPVGPDSRLVSVAHDHVVLERAGQRIRVAFPPPGASLIAPLNPAGPAQPAQIAVVAAAPAASASTQTDIAAAMGFETVPRGDGRLGLSVSPGGESGLAAAAGLQTGDIVLALNGRDITHDGLAARQGELLSGAPLEIRFERNGQVLTTRLGR
jgi:general secretion pathway protein C